jgi:glycosyltransferase involved in cell wall biosynthesis
VSGSAPLRILHTIHTVNPATGGTSEAVLQLAGAHRRMGHVVEIASLDAPSDAWLTQSPVKVHALGPGRGSFGYSARFEPWLRAHAGDFDVVVANGFWQHHNVGTWRALRGTGTRYCFFAHGMLDVWFRRTYPLKHVKKCVYWWLWQHRAMEQAARVIFTSHEEWRNSRCSFTPFRCRHAIVPLGIAAPAGDREPQQRAFFEQVPAARGGRLILFLGRLHVKKGCDLLVEAVRAMRCREAWDREGWRVAIVGPCADAAWRAELEARGAEGATRMDIVWGGMLAGDAKWGAFHAAEAFILPSHQENFGVAVIEALACGVPALLSDQVNIWREVASDGAGIVEHDDAAGTVRLLERWIALSAAERQQMKERAQRCFAQRYEIDRAAAALIDLFQAHLTPTPRAP